MNDGKADPQDDGLPWPSMIIRYLYFERIATSDITAADRRVVCQPRMKPPNVGERPTGHVCQKNSPSQRVEMGQRGLEPPTSPLSGVRSSQLSY